MDYFLGIDLGTSYFKAGIFDESGHLKGLGRQYVHKITDGTICELPVNAFWTTIRHCIDEAVQMAGIHVNAIKSISYSTQANSFILLDAHNNPLTPLIMWPDQRASDLELPFVDAEELMKRTGLGIIPGAQSAIAKINWFRKYRHNVWNKVAFILSISDFLTFSLTGHKVSDYSTASMSGLFDIVNLSWWKEQLENNSINVDKLSLPQKIGTLVGTTTINAPKLTGLPPGIVYCLGGLDHHIAAIGTGIPSGGYINESTGTVLSCVDYSDSYFPQKNICTAPGLDDGCFFRMVFNENGASSLEWYQKNYAPEYNISELLEMASLVESGCDGLTALPCAGTYSGLNGFKHTGNIHYGHGHYVRALLESTAHSLLQLVTTLKKDTPVPVIVSSGGGSRSELWVAIKSEIVANAFPQGEGRDEVFLIPECTESSCLGAAMIGALGTHSFDSYEKIADAWIRFKKRI